MLGALFLAIVAPPSVAAPSTYLRFETGRHTASVRGIARDPQGGWITVGLDKAVRRWRDGRPAGPPLRFATGAGADGSFTSCDVSSKGLLAVGENDAEGPGVWLYPLKGGTVRRISLPRRDENAASTIYSVAFSADGRLLATGDNAGAVRVWNVESRREVGSKTIVPGRDQTGYGVFGVAFSEGQVAYAAAATNAASPDQKGYVGILDATKKELPQVSKVELDHRLACIDWHDPKAIAIGGAKGSLDLWTPGEGATKPLATGLSAPFVMGVARSADGKTTVAGAGDGTVVVFSGATKAGSSRPSEGGLRAVALAPDGRTALVGLETGGVYEVPTAGGKPRELSPAAPAATGVKWSASGDALRWQSDESALSFNLARSEPGVKQTDAADGGHKLGGATVAADAQGRVAITGIADWARLTQDAPAYDAVFLDADHVLAATTRGLQIHDRVGIPKPVPAEGGMPRSLARSPDGSKIAVGFGDGIVRIYAAKPFSEAPIASLFVGSGEWVAWQEATGEYDSSVGGDSIFGYQVNRGEDELATFVPAVMKQQFRKPGLLAKMFGGGAPPPPPPSNAASPLAASLAEVPGITVVGVEEGRQTDQGWEVEGKTATVKVRVQNQTTGRLSARIGHGTPRELPGVIDVENPDGSDRYCKVTGLAPGMNLVQLYLGNQPLKGSEIVVVSKQPGIEVAERMLVLAIGVGEYGNPEMKENALEFAVPDAKEFVQAMEELSPGTGKAVVKPLFDKTATKAEVEKGLDWLKAEAKPTDRVVVYIASHGDPRKEATYITPYDYSLSKPESTGISWTTIAQKLKAVDCRSLVLFSDNCYSGAAVLAARQTQTMGMRGVTSDMAVFAACGADQRSYEFDDLKHGLFTYALLAGMRGKIEGQASDRATGLVTTDILKASLPNYMRDLQKGKNVGDPQRPIILVPDSAVPITRVRKVAG